MKMEVLYWYKQEYLPTRRHRKPRERHEMGSVEVDIAEPDARDFPIAFTVEDYGYLYEADGTEPEFGIHASEIRAYRGKLWKAVRASEFRCHAAGWADTSTVKQRLDSVCREPYHEDTGEFSVQSIVKSDNITECIRKVMDAASCYLVFDGKVWMECGEPMYMVNTFGLGHNHGGTGIFIKYGYNPNIPNRNYFPATRRDEAIAYAVQVAGRRGDTESIPDLQDERINIKVHMPGMVRRDPMREHGEGDTFQKRLNEITERSGSAFEAGLLAIMLATADVCG